MSVENQEFVKDNLLGFLVPTKTPVALPMYRTLQLCQLEVPTLIAYLNRGTQNSLIYY